MLGRDDAVDIIYEEMINASDKFPPITVISTSRAGKTLLLDTLVAKHNSDPNCPVYVVTCSLNGTRVSGGDFKAGSCTSADVPLFVAFVLNALLFGSIGNHQKPTSANAQSLAWPTVLDPTRLCTLIRERHGLNSKKKLILAVDELTTFFDRFDEDSRAKIATALGQLCNSDSRLLLTGFTNNANNAFLGVSKRQPVQVDLPSITCSNRHHLIPLMTAMLWGVRGALAKVDSAYDSPNSRPFQLVYCVIHETLKSSPGLMGTVVERLVRNDVPLRFSDFSMWGILNATMELFPDSASFNDPTTRARAFNALADFMLHPCQEETALLALMMVNMASPNRLDVFRVTCLLYTSDAADEEDSVDLGGPRLIKKKKK
eukprot:TRINITY_DN7854_c0_g1_i1.p1 TRINITY_DN7854_c0_g1~~TRINITY_DN7854_c0_g1_i1.p1  ORF type:complete len:373 (+),score=25.07 TRINITY_DN7854_c0_g1_i1:244-1362(+)